MARVEVINTGTELLLGSVFNSHLPFLALRLQELGLRIERQVTVPDGAVIGEALRDTFGRAEVVIVTGGLGPTTDDVTRDCAAELLGLALYEDAAVMQSIADRFARRRLKLTERIGRQAQVPEGAEVLPNANGTAPGLYLRARDLNGTAVPHLFLLPGPPRELIPMFEAGVVPRLQRIAGEPNFISRTFRIAGLGESQVEALIGQAILALGEIELGYCARPGEVDVRCVGAPELVSQAAGIIEHRLGPHVFGEGAQTLEEKVVALLAGRSETLACAESCTGGLLANRITNVPGSSSVFLGGYVTYANEVKVSALGVPKELIEEHGAVSEPVARAMAEGVRAKTGATYALATTGIAGPGGGSEEKPVGTLYIGFAAGNAETVVERHSFLFERETFKRISTQTALNLLRRRLAGRE